MKVLQAMKTRFIMRLTKSGPATENNKTPFSEKITLRNKPSIIFHDLDEAPFGITLTKLDSLCGQIYDGYPERNDLIA